MNKNFLIFFLLLIFNQYVFGNPQISNSLKIYVDENGDQSLKIKQGNEIICQDDCPGVDSEQASVKIWVGGETFTVHFKPNYADATQAIYYRKGEKEKASVADLLDDEDFINVTAIDVKIDGLGKGKVFSTFPVDCPHPKNDSCLIFSFFSLKAKKKELIWYAIANEDTEVVEAICPPPLSEQQQVLECRVTFDLKEENYPGLHVAGDGNPEDKFPSFFGGVFENKVGNYPQNNVQFNQEKIIQLRGGINVAAPNHIGQKADIVVVMGHIDESKFYIKNSDSKLNDLSTWSVWDGAQLVKEIDSFKEGITLQTREVVEIYKGTLKKGKWIVYFSYRLYDGPSDKTRLDDSMFFNLIPISFEIVDDISPFE